MKCGGCTLFALLALHVVMARASEVSAPILDRGAMTTVYPSDSDIVTAYATEMARYRVALSARVGDSKDGFIIGPEAPGVAPTGPFRGKDDGIKPQGARFRVFQVDIGANGNETVSREVTGARDVQIEWTVQLANRKAAARQIFGDGNGTLTRNNAAKPAHQPASRASRLRHAKARRPALRDAPSDRVPGSRYLSGLPGANLEPSHRSRILAA